MLTWENDVDAHALRRQGWTITAIAVNGPCSGMVAGRSGAVVCVGNTMRTHGAARSQNRELTFPLTPQTC